MDTITTGRKVVALVLTVLMIALAMFAAASANRANDAQAREKGPTVQQKQQLCVGDPGQWICF